MTTTMTFASRREAAAHIRTMRGWPCARPVSIVPSPDGHHDAQGTGDWHGVNERTGRYPAACHCLAVYPAGRWIIRVDGTARALDIDGYVS